MKFSVFGDKTISSMVSSVLLICYGGPYFLRFKISLTNSPNEFQYLKNN